MWDDVFAPMPELPLHFPREKRVTELSNGRVQQKARMRQEQLERNNDRDFLNMKNQTTSKRISKRAKERFEYFARCEDTNRLPRIEHSDEGLSALECFHSHETHGTTPPCREPELLSRALNGKEWHGVTVTNCAEDYIGRILFADELKANYPDWVRRDILGRASQLSMKKLGFVPSFVKSGEDFTTLSVEGIKLPL
jgi:hypothetical protein